MFDFVWTSFEFIEVVETRNEVLVDTRLVCDTNTGHREVCICIISIQGRHGEILSLDIRHRQIKLNLALYHPSRIVVHSVISVSLNSAAS